MSRGELNKELEELLESIDMETYLDIEGIDYKPTFGSSGPQLNVKTCPVCGGSSSKVYLNSDTGLGNCFHGDCETKFNKYSFIKAHTGVEKFKDMMTHLKATAREMGWRPKKLTSVDVNIEKPELVLPASLPLPIDGKNVKYLAQRGINSDIAKYFNLRLSVDGRFWYKAEDGEVRFQNYSNRIIIPIFDMDGEMVSFQGRDILGTAEKKYLFPPGFASTGKYLYNSHNSKGAVRAVLNEGAFDVFATKIALDEEIDLRDVAVMGSFGKHLSYGSDECKDQIGELIKLKHLGLKEVVIMWDSEQSALNAACDAAAMIMTLGIHVRIAILPAGKDPNEVPPQVVRQAFYKAVPATKANIVKIKMGMLR